MSITILSYPFSKLKKFPNDKEVEFEENKGLESVKVQLNHILMQFIYHLRSISQQSIVMNNTIPIFKEN